MAPSPLALDARGPDELPVVADATAPVLSVVIPVYNERRTVAAVIERLASVTFPCTREIIIVDDGSVDGTPTVLAAFTARPDMTVLALAQNRGKGAAVLHGVAHARGRILAIQDADLELDPAQLPALVGPILEGTAEVVYGSRFLAGPPVMSGMGRVANMTLTWLTNRLCRSHITDMETCYKIVPVDVIRSLDLVSRRFDFEPEVTAKLLLRGYRITELPVRVESRSRALGKKMRWTDGVTAISVLIRCVVAHQLSKSDSNDRRAALGPSARAPGRHRP